MPTERPDIPSVAGERETPRAFLDFHRAPLAMKCDDLSDDELRRAAWFRRIFGGEADLQLVCLPDGDFQAPRWGEEVSLRMVPRHMIHEYARHNGHSDLVREGIDGRVGV